MNKESLYKTKAAIKKGSFPNVFPEFGGAGLIITKEENKPFRDQEDLIIIYTQHASAISWLVNDLKNIYATEINSSNKYNFYPFIGRTIQKAIENNYDVFEVLEDILFETDNFFSRQK